MCPLGAPLFYHPDTPPAERKLVCHCLLVETERNGLVLVDTGMGAADVGPTDPRIAGFFRMMNRPRLAPGERALEQLGARGFSPRDVRHIVLTHLDFDHAGGIGDFPWAEIHVLRAEHHAATAPGGFIGNRRYRPRQWRADTHWRLYGAEAGEPWFGFSAVRQLAGLPPEILMVPLRGHTFGHAGVAVQHAGGWLLHAGDAYFDHLELHPTHPRCAPGRRFYQWMMDSDRPARLDNQQRLRNLIAAAHDEVQVFCSHDASELRSARPAQAASERAAREPSALAPT